MTVKGGSRPACAACRFQRRRCSPDCPLAPFFPANEPKIFQSVHSLYGVGHIMKILNQLPDDEKKEEAMISIKYESNIRQLNRVHGCYGLIVQLNKKIHDLSDELECVLHVLDVYKNNCKPNCVNEMNNDQNVGGSSDHWDGGMNNIVEGDNIGFHYTYAASDHVGGYDRDDRTETTVDVTPNRSLFDEFQQYCCVEEHGEGSQDYAEMICGSFVDDQHQQSFLGSNEAHALKLESPEASYFSEHGEVKDDEKLFQGTRSLG